MMELKAESNKRQKVDNKCSYTNPKKNNKRCGLQVRKGQKYCFAHINKVNEDLPKESEITRKSKKGEVIKRVTCTIDPSHTVWEDRLTKHLKICNVVKEKLEIENKEKNCDWFSLDYNVNDSLTPQKFDKGISLDYDVWKSMIPEVVKKHDEFFKNDLEFNDIKYTKGLEERFAEVTNQKHILQQSSLIGQLIEHSLINPENVVIEFGCGRAEFTRYYNKAMNEMFKGTKKYTPQYLLIDRENPRLKFDKKIAMDSEQDQVKNTEVERLKVDIKDLKLAESLKTFKSQQYVAISKHLCGVATDLTLRCLTNSIIDDKDINFKGCVIAMCCRHCCNYEWLMEESKEFLNKFGINSSNFIYFRKMFAWATNGVNPGMSKTDVGDHFSKMSYAQREEIGLKIRRILDESRKYAMKKRGFDVTIVKYVDRSVSLENNCIIIK